LVTPAASNALRWLSSSPTYTLPLATTGDERLPPSELGARYAVHNGWHVFGLPEQFALPVASKAINFRDSELTYTMPFVTAGDEYRSPVAAVQSSEHVFGLPAQFSLPSAVYACSRPSAEPT
jgi:hypothetical protein